MRILSHPPLEITGGRVARTASLTSYLHGALWLVVEVKKWGARREAHLHAVRSLAGGEWRLVDLSRHPLTSGSWQPARPPSAEIAAELIAWVAERPPRLYRLATLDAVSELGERPDDFRRRMLGALRPELQRRVASVAEAPMPRWPWRRRAEVARRERLRHGIASEIGGLVTDIEEWRSENPTSTIRRLEVGVVLVADGIELDPPMHRDLML